MVHFSALLVALVGQMFQWFSLRRLFVLAGLSVGIKPPEGLSVSIMLN